MFSNTSELRQVTDDIVEPEEDNVNAEGDRDEWEDFIPSFSSSSGASSDDDADG